MWEEIERSPMLAAPGSEESTYANLIGPNDEDIQGANDLCEKYLPLARRIASGYRDRGVHYEDLCSAAVLGLTLASRKFHPNRGAFGPYAEFWIKGEVKALFKGSNPLNSAQSLTNDEGFQNEVAAPAPAVSPDLSVLSETDRHIVEARLRGKTLVEIGKTLGISAERVRQRESRSHSKIRGDIASECISDLVGRGQVTGFPGERARRWVEFCDREPPKHVYREPQASRQLVRHRAHAPRLAALRGNEPFRREGGPYGGAIVISWEGRP
jgi:RNA polymerase sigma factor (sigma-70 family)